jgi:hypothetical protein
MPHAMPASDIALALTPRRANQRAAACDDRHRRAAIGRRSAASVTDHLAARCRLIQINSGAEADPARAGNESAPPSCRRAAYAFSMFQ